MKSKIVIIVTLFAALMFVGCEKDENNQPPELPPMESVVIDFSNFNDSSDTLNNEKGLADYNHWGNAFLTVSGWNVFITMGMAVPVVAYKEALKQSPVYLGEDQWEWTYDITANSLEYSATLVAEKISNEEFTATMYISRSGTRGFDDFKWFEGTVRYDHTYASWTIYENPADTSPMITIEWNRDWEADTLDITYTNIRPDDNENGSFISYSVDPAKEFDASYTISLSSGETLIEWNQETKAGRIMSTERFGNDSWYCWDENLKNIVCQ
ncbi:MAG: hypothetical protein ACLFQA_01230 [Bacteroidales bacterium]